MVEPIIAEVNLQSMNVTRPMVEHGMIGGRTGLTPAGGLSINLELTFYGDESELMDLRTILQHASIHGKLFLSHTNPNKLLNNDASEVIKKEDAKESYASKEVW